MSSLNIEVKLQNYKEAKENLDNIRVAAQDTKTALDAFSQIELSIKSGSINKFTQQVNQIKKTISGVGITLNSDAFDTLVKDVEQLQDRYRKAAKSALEFHKIATEISTKSHTIDFKGISEKDRNNAAKLQDAFHKANVESNEMNSGLAALQRKIESMNLSDVGQFAGNLENVKRFEAYLEHAMSTVKRHQKEINALLNVKSPASKVKKPAAIREDLPVPVIKENVKSATEIPITFRPVKSSLSEARKTVREAFKSMVIKLKVAIHQKSLDEAISKVDSAAGALRTKRNVVKQETPKQDLSMHYKSLDEIEAKLKNISQTQNVIGDRAKNLEVFKLDTIDPRKAEAAAKDATKMIDKVTTAFDGTGKELAEINTLLDDVRRNFDKGLKVDESIESLERYRKELDRIEQETKQIGSELKTLMKADPKYMEATNKGKDLYQTRTQRATAIIAKEQKEPTIMPAIEAVDRAEGKDIISAHDQYRKISKEFKTAVNDLKSRLQEFHGMNVQAITKGMDAEIATIYSTLDGIAKLQKEIDRVDKIAKKGGWHASQKRDYDKLNQTPVNPVTAEEEIRYAGISSPQELRVAKELLKIQQDKKLEYAEQQKAGKQLGDQEKKVLQMIKQSKKFIQDNILLYENEVELKNVIAQKDKKMLELAERRKAVERAISDKMQLVRAHKRGEYTGGDVKDIRKSSDYKELEMRENQLVEMYVAERAELTKLIKKKNELARSNAELANSVNQNLEAERIYVGHTKKFMDYDEDQGTFSPRDRIAAARKKNQQSMDLEPTSAMETVVHSAESSVVSLQKKINGLTIAWAEWRRKAEMSAEMTESDMARISKAIKENEGLMGKYKQTLASLLREQAQALKAKETIGKMMQDPDFGEAEINKLKQSMADVDKVLANATTNSRLLKEVLDGIDAKPAEAVKKIAQEVKQFESGADSIEKLIENLKKLRSEMSKDIDFGSIDDIEEIRKAITKTRKEFSRADTVIEEMESSLHQLERTGRAVTIDGVKVSPDDVEGIKRLKNELESLKNASTELKTAYFKLREIQLSKMQAARQEKSALNALKEAQKEVTHVVEDATEKQKKYNETMHAAQKALDKLKFSERNASNTGRLDEARGFKGMIGGLEQSMKDSRDRGALQKGLTDQIVKADKAAGHYMKTLERGGGAMQSWFAKYSIYMSGIAASLFVFQNIASAIERLTSLGMDLEKTYAGMARDFNLSANEMKAISDIARDIQSTSSMTAGTAAEEIAKKLAKGKSPGEAVIELRKELAKSEAAFNGTISNLFAKFSNKLRDINLEVFDEYTDVMKDYINRASNWIQINKDDLKKMAGSLIEFSAKVVEVFVPALEMMAEVLKKVTDVLNAIPSEILSSLVVAGGAYAVGSAGIKTAGKVAGMFTSTSASKLAAVGAGQATAAAIGIAGVPLIGGIVTVAAAAAITAFAYDWVKKKGEGIKEKDILKPYEPLSQSISRQLSVAGPIGAGGLGVAFSSGMFRKDPKEEVKEIISETDKLRAAIEKVKKAKVLSVMDGDSIKVDIQGVKDALLGLKDVETVRMVDYDTYESIHQDKSRNSAWGRPSAAMCWCASPAMILRPCRRSPGRSPPKWRRFRA